MTNNANAAIEALDALLEDERNALLAGELELLPDVLGAKEELIERLTALQPDASRPMLQLQQKMTRNQMLLDSALHGIRRAAARLAALRKVRRSLETYDETGQRKTIAGPVTHRIEKRA
ncbi:MAG: flagellar protein FlgN [Pseudomonadota bacterium]